MTWFKIDDAFHSHPKVLAVGNAAAGLFVRFGSYSSQQLTDGFIPAGLAKLYGTKGEIGRLVAEGLLDEVAGGYQIPDFLDFNPSAEKVRERRARNAERVAEWRSKHAGNADVTPLQNRRVTRAVTALVTRPVTLPPTRPDPTRNKKSPRHEVTSAPTAVVDNSASTARRPA